MRHTYAEMWYCGDECDCREPQIVERSDGDYRSTDWKGPVVIESGSFLSEPEPEQILKQWEWLLEAARRHNVKNLTEIEAKAAAYTYTNIVAVTINPAPEVKRTQTSWRMSRALGGVSHEGDDMPH